MTIQENLKKIKQAHQLYQKWQFAEALPLLREANRLMPEDGETWMALGEASFEENDFATARHAFEQVLVYGAKDPRWYVYFMLAATLAQLGENDAALDWLEKSVQTGLFPRRRGVEHSSFATLQDNPRFRELSGLLPAHELSRDEGWRYDLAFLQDEMRRLHPQGAAIVASTEFQAAVQALHEAIPTLSDAQIYMRLQALMVYLGDGHSTLYPIATPQITFAALPLRFYWFQDQLYIIEGADYVGARVTAIGDVTMAALRALLPTLIPHDNPQTIRWISPILLTMPIYLQHLGATDTLSRVTLELVLADGTAQTVTVECGENTLSLETMMQKLTSEATHAPLFMQNTDQHQWLQPLPDWNALYMGYHQVRNAPDQSVAQFAERLQQTLHDTHAQTLIVDVRQNNGGNNFLNKPLLKTLIHFEQSDPAHQIFVIIGRMTFSACQNFINLLDRFTNAIFVGEPSGSSINFIGESTQLYLPYSQIMGSISCYLWQDSHSFDHRIWIAPHLRVEYTAADYFGGHDPALAMIEAALTEASS